MRTPLLLAACILGAMTLPSLAKMPSEAQQMRQQAEHLCYDDVQKLCNAAIPDEDKITACMGAHHAQLSPACAKIYDQGLGG